jgi:hypothetical protein
MPRHSFSLFFAGVHVIPTKVGISFDAAPPFVFFQPYLVILSEAKDLPASCATLLLFFGVTTSSRRRRDLTADCRPLTANPLDFSFQCFRTLEKAITLIHI